MTDQEMTEDDWELLWFNQDQDQEAETVNQDVELLL